MLRDSVLHGMWLMEHGARFTCHGLCVHRCFCFVVPRLHGRIDQGSFVSCAVGKVLGVMVGGVMVHGQCCASCCVDLDSWISVLVVYGSVLIISDFQFIVHGLWIRLHASWFVES